MNAVDTNILIYVHDQRDTFKQATAESLIRRLPDAVLLCRCPVSTLRPVESWSRMVTVAPARGRIFTSCGLFGRFYFPPGTYWFGRKT